MLGEFLENVRKKRPLIHNITNRVTVNDCANMLLACGASPIMSDDIEEVEEITALCDGLNINIGTPGRRTLTSMLAAGKKANSLSHPTVLDPVGAGTSAFRTNAALDIMNSVHPSLIRGNISEIKALALGGASTHGVDAAVCDTVTEDTLEAALIFAADFAKKSSAIVAVTGAVDIVTDGTTAYCIFNGHPLMSRVCGTGCQLSAMSAAFIAANKENMLLAAAAAVCTMGICGEIAYSRLGPSDGTGSYRIYLTDAVSNIDGKTLDEKAKYKIF